MAVVGYFPATVVVNESTFAPIVNAEGQVFAAADTTFSSPLSITDVQGVPFPGSKLVANSRGITQSFRAPAGVVEVRAKFGEAVTPMISLSVYAEAAETAATTAQVAAGAAGEARDQAAIERERAEDAADAAAAVGATTDTQIEGRIKDPASKTAQAVTDMIGTVGGAAFATKNGAAQTIDAQTTFTSLNGLRSSTYFGLGAGVGSARNPFYANVLVDAALAGDTLAAGGGDDYVGLQTNVTAKGNYAARRDQFVGSITAGSTTLTSSTPLPARVVQGWTAYVAGAGVGGGVAHKTKITAVSTDRLTLTLATAAATTVSGATSYASLAADHDYFFFANDFFRTDSTFAGVRNLFGRLMEVHLYTPNLTLDAIRAASAELAIEAGSDGSTIGTGIGFHVKSVANKSAATIQNVRGLFVEAPTATGTSSTYTIYGQGGASWLSGATRIGGEGAVGQVPLVVQRPLGATAVAFEVRDFTLANRFFSIGGGGAAASVSFITAFEGLGAQTQIGAVSGGFAGIRFGSAGVELRQHTTGGVQLFNAKAFGAPAVATAQRLSASNAGAGGVYFDITLGKLIVSDGTNWKDMTGATV